MRKKILILEALLSILFISCTDSDMDGIMPSGQEVCINFTAQPKSDYTINVGTRGAADINVGILGVAATESDSLLDCLTGLTEDSFCHTLCNAEFTGTLPGGLTSVDGTKHVFPLEEESAIAAYAYSPYSAQEVTIGDTSCYISIDVANNRFMTDYLYTGKVFKSKMKYREDETFTLPFSHAFANIETTFKSIVELEGITTLVVDTFELLTNHNGKGLLDLKNGLMIPDKDGYADTMSYRTNLLTSPIIINEENPQSKLSIYFPPAIHLDSIRISGRKDAETFDRTYAVPYEVGREQFEKAKRYYMTFATPSSFDVNWTVDPYAFQYDMTVYVGLEVNGKRLTDMSRYTIGAFYYDECRGRVEIKNSAAGSYGYLRIRSNKVSGETITFKVYDKNTGKIVTAENTLYFTSQNVIGYPSTPFVVKAVYP